MRSFVILLVVCIVVPLATTAAGDHDHDASVASASCSASKPPSESTRAVTQSALLACSTVLQPTGALDWFIDVQQVRLRDVLDGHMVEAVRLQPHPNITLAELVQMCWPSFTVPVRVFLSDVDHELHTRACATAAVAAVDALQSPLLALTRVVLYVESLPALPIALAAFIVPHVTVAVLLFYTAPASMVLAPLWSSAIILFALIDLHRTLSRASAAFRSMKGFLIFFVRRLFVRIVIALGVAAIDIVAAEASDGKCWLTRPHFDCASHNATLPPPFPPCSHRCPPPRHRRACVLPLFRSSLLETPQV
jgi:hypothetical protein